MKAPELEDSERLRCSWTADDTRCRYAGAIAHSKDGPFFCSGHFGCSDPVVGSQIVEESVREHPVCPDYSPRATLDRIRALYRKGEEVPRAPVHEKKVRLPDLTTIARRGDDPDAITERMAMQTEVPF